MSSGPRYKFQGSTISFLTELVTGSPAKDISNITNANPAVVTSSGHGLSNGDVISIVDVAGMTEVNDRAYIVAGKTTTTFELYGVDSTTYGTYGSASGSFYVGDFSTFCALTSANRTGASKTSIPATTVCSVEEEFEVGLAGQGTIAIDYNYAPLTDSVQVAIEAFDRSGDTTAFKIQLPKSGGTITRLGFVQQTSDKGQVNSLWTASATLLLTGPAYFQAAT